MDRTAARGAIQRRSYLHLFATLLKDCITRSKPKGNILYDLGSYEVSTCTNFTLGCQGEERARVLHPMQLKLLA